MVPLRPFFNFTSNAGQIKCNQLFIISYYPVHSFKLNFTTQVVAYFADDHDPGFR